MREMLFVVVERTCRWGGLLRVIHKMPRELESFFCELFAEGCTGDSQKRVSGEGVRLCVREFRMVNHRCVHPYLTLAEFCLSLEGADVSEPHICQ